MRNVLLLIHHDRGQESRYQAALDVTRAIGGHLTCVDLTMIPEFIGDYVGATGAILADEQADEAANKVRMLARLEREDVSFDWIDRTGFTAQTIRDHAGLSDLVVLSCSGGGQISEQMNVAIGDTLLRVGKPVLAVPMNAPSFNLCGRALVAWDGSDDAEAALQAAAPLLSKAETVTIYHNEDGSLRIPAEDAARYLARHGIEPVIKCEPAGSRRPAEEILAECRSGGHDWIVMGAYGRGRVIEEFFGGATRSMLKESPVPLFLMHKR